MPAPTASRTAGALLPLLGSAPRLGNAPREGGHGFVGAGGAPSPPRGEGGDGPERAGVPPNITPSLGFARESGAGGGRKMSFRFPLPSQVSDFSSFPELFLGCKINVYSWQHVVVPGSCRQGGFHPLFPEFLNPRRFFSRSPSPSPVREVGQSFQDVRK